MDIDNNERSGAVQSVADSARITKDAAQTVINATKDKAKEKLADGAERVAEGAQTAADSLRRAADEVSSEHAWMGSALRKSADGLEAATQSLAGGDIDAALSKLAGFARRQPAIFLGASLAVGFALARVGKTAAEHVSAEIPSVKPADTYAPPMTNGGV